MPGLFICYRRDDSAGHAGRIFDSMRDAFGKDRVFMDLTAIEGGQDFVEVIKRAVSSSDVMLAVIGREWLTATDEHGKRRLDDPEDFIPLELGTALASNVRVIPVLVEGARMPRAADLPEALKALTRRQAVELRDSRWSADVQELVDLLRKTPLGAGDREAVRDSQPGRRGSWLTWASVGLAVIVAAVLGFNFLTSEVPNVASPSPAAQATPTVPASGPIVPQPSPSAPEPSPSAPEPSPSVPEPSPSPPEPSPSAPEPSPTQSRSPAERPTWSIVVYFADARSETTARGLAEYLFRVTGGRVQAVRESEVGRAQLRYYFPEDAERARGIAERAQRWLSRSGEVTLPVVYVDPRAGVPSQGLPGRPGMAQPGWLDVHIPAPSTSETDRVKVKQMVRVPQTFMVDADEGRVASGNAADLWFEAVTATERYLSPVNGASLAAAPRGARLADCESARARYGLPRIPLARVRAGSEFCVRTNGGRYGVIQLSQDLAPDSTTLVLSVRTWEALRRR